VFNHRSGNYVASLLTSTAAIQRLNVNFWADSTALKKARRAAEKAAYIQAR